MCLEDMLKYSQLLLYQLNICKTKLKLLCVSKELTLYVVNFRFTSSNNLLRASLKYVQWFIRDLTEETQADDENV